jgi:uncharacterized protein YecT (DUF1311 family)
MRWVAGPGVGLVVVAVLVASGAAGGTRAAAPSYKDCLRRATTTVATEDCIKTERARLATALSATYARVASRPGLGTRRAAQLAAGQRAWLRYERADCDFNGSLVSGGTLEPVVFGKCVVARERERLAVLRGYAHFPE